MNDKKLNYQKLNNRLDEVLAAMQAPDITVDEAVALYEEGSKLTDALREYLQEAEIKITKINATT